MKSRIIRLVLAALTAAGAAWVARRDATSTTSPNTPEEPAGATPAPNEADADAPTREEHDDPEASPHTGQNPPASPEPEREPESSSLDEVIDGGYGVGSAAPIAGGSMPLGHTVKAWEDTRTFAEPGQDAYAAEPHVWFRDADTAAAAGFSPAP